MQNLLGKVIPKIKRKITNWRFKFIVNKTDVLILDNFFPNPISVFRYVEYDAYLSTYKSIAFTTGAAIHLLDKVNSLDYFIQNYDRKSQVKVFDSRRRVKAKLAILVFIGIANEFLEYIENNEIPFIFTLYPGGGFLLNDEISNKMLIRVFNSPFFRKVIVTQNIVLNYLLENDFCAKEEIEFIYGCPIGLSELKLPELKLDTSITNICFVAAKYLNKGEDKGYDIFIEVAKRLLKFSKKFRFHVVGGFDENDIDVSEIDHYICFYGYLSIEQLRLFYQGQDVILSPNRANTLSNGAFDGFPTASVVEAGLNGVIMMVSDELNQNIFFKDQFDCIFINHNVDQIVDQILFLQENPKIKFDISNNTVNTLYNVFNDGFQIKARLEIISQFVN